MNVSVELSLYPLAEDYKEHIISFIKELKAHDSIMVEVNGMSTQIFGDYDVVMSVLGKELKKAIFRKKCVAVMKLGAGILTSNKLPEELK